MKRSSTRGCRCRVEWLDVRMLPVGGPSWGILVCTRCGQPRKWLAPPKPLVEAVEPLPPPPAWLVTLAERHQGGPASLVGTERQCQWASSIRTEMRSKSQDDPTMLSILDVINHVGWYFKNRGDIRSWPTPAEVVAAPDD